MSERELAAPAASKPFLARLAPDDRRALEAAARRRRFPKGAVVFWEGDATDDVIILVSGRMKASVASSDGREVILSIIDAGDILGELSALDGAPRSATVATLESVEALVVPRSRFDVLVRDRPGIAIEMLRIVTRRLRGSSQRQLEFATVDALGRLCRCVLDLVDRYGEPGPDGRSVQVPFAQHDLAAWTGLSREAIVKGLRTLRALGWIETSGRRLTLLDEAAVRDRARLSPAPPG